MKYTLLAKLIVGIIFLILISVSCNKNDISIINSNENKNKEMILSYLNEQKIIDLKASLFIDTLTSKSDWSRIQETSISKDVTIIYVPLNYNRNRIGMTFLYDNNTQSIYYSLITETPIIQSKITRTKDPSIKSPIDVIAGFYKYDMNGYTGSIKAFTLSNKFLWEYGFQNGTKEYEKLITKTKIIHQSNNNSPKNSFSSESNLVKSSGCTFYYLVTYYINSNGYQIDNWELIGITCDDSNPCQTSMGISEGSDIIKAECGGSNPGGGAGPGPGEIEIDKIINKVTDECLKNLLKNLQNGDKLTNSISGILYNVFGKNNAITINFSQDDNIKNSRGKEAYGQSYRDNNGVYQVKLNARLLKANKSEESQTLTIMHEILHDYFIYQYHEESKITFPNSHTVMLNYINKMATSLEELYPQLKQTPNLAIALVFDNLESSVNSADNLVEAYKYGEIMRSDFKVAYESFGFNSISSYQQLANQANSSNSNLGTKPCGSSIRNGEY